MADKLTIMVTLNYLHKICAWWINLSRVSLYGIQDEFVRISFTTEHNLPNYQPSLPNYQENPNKRLLPSFSCTIYAHLEYLTSLFSYINYLRWKYLTPFCVTLTYFTTINPLVRLVKLPSLQVTLTFLHITLVLTSPHILAPMKRGFQNQLPSVLAHTMPIRLQYSNKFFTLKMCTEFTLFKMSDLRLFDLNLSIFIWS